MKKLTCTLLFAAAILLHNVAYCQNVDSEKQAQIKYLAQDLSVSEAKAEQVVLVLNQYKIKVFKTRRGCSSVLYIFN